MNSRQLILAMLLPHRPFVGDYVPRYERDNCRRNVAGAWFWAIYPEAWPIS